MFWLVILFLVRTAIYSFRSRGAQATPAGLGTATKGFWAGLSSLPTGQYQDGKVWRGT